MQIAHYDFARVNDVHVNVADRDLGSVARAIERTIDVMEFANGVSVTLRGPVNKMQTGMNL